VVGGVGGGLAGKAVAEKIDPTAEEAYWRENYRTRPYYEEGEAFETYAPAYRHGWESRSRYPDRRFEDVERELRSDWERSPRSRSMGWEKARQATRDAWHRVERAIPGDADRDGR
jgi:hypothetical protein